MAKTTGGRRGPHRNRESLDNQGRPTGRMTRGQRYDFIPAAPGLWWLLITKASVISSVWRKFPR